MISQFFVVSPRGDTLIFKDYRGDVPRTTSEKFWRHVKFCKGDAEPVFVSLPLRAPLAILALSAPALLPPPGRAARPAVLQAACCAPAPAWRLAHPRARSCPVCRGCQLHVREEERLVPRDHLSLQPLAVHDPGAPRAPDPVRPRSSPLLLLSLLLFPALSPELALTRRHVLAAWSRTTAV